MVHSGVSYAIPPYWKSRPKRDDGTEDDLMCTFCITFSSAGEGGDMGVSLIDATPETEASAGSNLSEISGLVETLLLFLEASG